MYLHAESVKVDSDEGMFTLEIEVEDWEGAYSIPNDNRLTLNIHNIDLDAFYEQVKARIGPYLREMHEARAEYRERVAFAADMIADAYEISDPKNPDHHSVHADIWDARAGK